MKTLCWKDYRLTAKDIAPYDTYVMYVNKGTPIADLVRDTQKWCEQQGSTDLGLMIYCHGSPGYLQLCAEGVKAPNLPAFAPLRPFFQIVEIRACLIAAGDAGRAFCLKMARVFECPVFGATGLQRNTGPDTLYGFEDDKRYDGDFYMHSMSGARSGPYREPPAP